MFTQVTCPQVIRPTALSAAAPCRRNVRHWGDQSDRRNTTALDKFSYAYLVISGEELTALLSVCAVCEVATDTHTEICVWGVEELVQFQPILSKNLFAKF